MTHARVTTDWATDGYENLFGPCGIEPGTPPGVLITKTQREKHAEWEKCRAQKQALDLQKEQEKIEAMKAETALTNATINAANAPQPSGMNVGKIVGFALLGVTVLVGGFFIIRKFAKGNAGSAAK